MQTLPALLVLASAVLHAYWNFLLKRAGGGQLVVGMSKVVEAVGLVPVVIVAAWWEPAAFPRLLALALVGGALVGVYYAMIAAAYRHADLSFAYPVARGGVLALLPLAGYLVFGERVHPVGGAGLVLILGGMGLQVLSAGSANLRGALFSLGAAVAAAAYTLWDKHAVGVVAPLVYFSAYSVLVGLGYGAFIATSHRGRGARACWVSHRGLLVRVAVANGVGYLMVLHALQTGVSSYVIGLRQSSIAFAALLGWGVLAERPVPAVWAGIALIVAGCLLVGFSPGG